jgi:hypothetical protein
MPFPAGMAPFQDAIWIKAYNGADPHYISWLESQRRWNINNLANGRNYVWDVCRHQP